MIGVPSKSNSPSSAASTPARIRISVDLPAPFSPMSTLTQFLWARKVTPSSATVPGYRFVIARASRMMSAFGVLKRGPPRRDAHGERHSPIHDRAGRALPHPLPGRKYPQDEAKIQALAVNSTTQAQVLRARPLPAPKVLHPPSVAQGGRGYPPGTASSPRFVWRLHPHVTHE